MNCRLGFLAALFVILVAGVFAADEDVYSQVSGILTQVETRLQDLKNESEEIRDFILTETIILQIAMGRTGSLLQADVKNPLYRDKILSKIAPTEAAAGKLEDAAATIFKIDRPLYKVDAHICAPQIQRYSGPRYKDQSSHGDLEARDLESAVSILESAPTPGAKASLFKDILSKNSALGNFEPSHSAALSQDSVSLGLSGLLGCAEGLLNMQQEKLKKKSPYQIQLVL